jgi:16S rRNA (guanine966-N2)-methyltransferase
VTGGGELRPTQDRVREALFSSLAERMPGCRFLDLFAGSGAVGIEAWSRGAAEVWWVERDARVFQALSRNVGELCTERAARSLPDGPEVPGVTHPVRSDVGAFLGHWTGAAPFDLIYVDPPYAETAEWARKTLMAVKSHSMLQPMGILTVEAAAGGDPVPACEGWQCTRVRRYGSTALHFFVETA